MSKTVVIIDYQLGNVFSVQQACEYLGFNSTISTSPETLLKADYAILPGVGAFRDSMQNLHNSGLAGAIKEFIKTGRPFMGVCLGLQLLLTKSEEFGMQDGLNIIPGTVKRFPTDEVTRSLKVPQIQWNQILEREKGNWNSTPLKECKSGDFMYFVHSYFAEPDDPKDILAVTNYGNLNYCSSILRENVFATQFHPEKSGLPGVNIYKQWFEYNKNL